MSAKRPALVGMVGLLTVFVAEGVESPDPGLIGMREEVALLEGQVTDDTGDPLVGAIVSVFGSRLGDTGLIAVTDEEGRFRLPQLPPGLYRLRAYLAGFLPSRFSRVELTGSGMVAPVSMQLPSVASEPLSAVDEPEPLDEAQKDRENRTAELKWLLRHAERSILQRQGVTVLSEETRSAKAPAAPEMMLSGELGVMATALDPGVSDFPGAGSGLDARLAYARLDIPASSHSRWLVDAQLMESVLSSWAGSAEFVTGSSGRHELHAGVSYGNHFYNDLERFRPPEAGLHYRRDGRRSTEWFGSVFGSERLSLGPAALEAGARYHYYSYLDQPGYVAPRVAVAWTPFGKEQTEVRGSVDVRVLAPGGEDLDLLARMVSADFVAPVEDTRRGLRAERTVRYQLSVDQDVDQIGTIEVRVFQEDANDQLVKAFLKEQPHLRLGPGHFLVSNIGDFRTRGFGLTFSREFGAVAGSIGYTFGVGRGMASSGLDVLADNEIHDLTTRLETHIDRTRTRLLAVYRLIHHPALVPTSETPSGATSLDSRFNIQVYQVLPFAGTTNWELMIALRNLFYEDVDTTAFLDEAAVIDSPRRLLGGVSVRF